VIFGALLWAVLLVCGVFEDKEKKKKVCSSEVRREALVSAHTQAKRGRSGDRNGYRVYCLFFIPVSRQASGNALSVVFPATILTFV